MSNNFYPCCCKCCRIINGNRCFIKTTDSYHERHLYWRYFRCAILDIKHENGNFFVGNDEIFVCQDKITMSPCCTTLQHAKRLNWAISCLSTHPLLSIHSTWGRLFHNDIIIQEPRSCISIWNREWKTTHDDFSFKPACLGCLRNLTFEPNGFDKRSWSCYR